MSDPDKRGLSLLASLEAEVSGAQRPRTRDAGSAEGQEAPASVGENRDRPEHRRRDRAARQDDSAARASGTRAQRGAIAPADLPRQLAPVTPLPQIPDRRLIEGMALPRREAKRTSWAFLSFLLFVALPVAVASVYYIVYASSQYVSEFRFAVREASSTGTATSGTSGLMSLLGTSASSSPVENYMVAEYLTSRQIVDELQAKINVKALYSRPNADWWARFDPSQPMEKFVSYWKNMVTANYDQITGIAVANVRAFTPGDAHLIATTMVSLAETLVNKIAMRSRLDAVRFAEQEVKRAQDRLSDIRTQLGEYRDKQAVIDPTSNVVASNTTLAQALRTTLMQYQTELTALTRQNLRPEAPSVLALQSRIDAVKQQLGLVEAQVATAKEGGQSLSRVVGQYEKLDLERQVAQNILTSSIQSLEQARVNASVQSLYVTPFVRPALPESSTYPKRFVSIMTVGFACFFLWTIGLLIVRSIREHLA